MEAAAINRSAMALSSADRLGFSTRPSIPPPPPPPRCTAAPAPAPEPETGFMDDAELIDGSEFYPKGVAPATSIGARLNAIGPPLRRLIPPLPLPKNMKILKNFPMACKKKWQKEEQQMKCFVKDLLDQVKVQLVLF